MPKKEYIAHQLTRLIQRGGFADTGRLPPVAALARRVKASRVTIRRALDLLAAQGMVEQAGSEFWLAGRRQSSLEWAGAPPEKLTRVDEITEAIRDGVLSGSFGRELPSVKELRLRHGCSRTTAGVALSRLSKEGLLERHGRLYRQAQPGLPSESTSHIHFLTDRWPVNVNGLSVVTGVERELEAHRWPRLRYVVGADAAVPPSSQVSGFIRFHPGGRDSWLERLPDPTPVPTVVVDLHEAGPTADEGRPNHYRVFPDNVRAGREIGHLLARLGHTKCVFLSDLDLTEGCCSLRLRGMEMVFPREDSGVSGRSCRPCDGSTLEFVTTPRMERINAALAGLREDVIAGSGLEALYVRESFSRTFGCLAWWRCYDAMRPLLQDALQDRSTTAWVCATDGMAMMAHAFLRENHVSIGRDIALACFGNTWVTQSLDITSYDLGFDRMGRLAFCCIAMPDQVVRKGRSIVHTPGQLVTRGSTGLGS